MAQGTPQILLESVQRLLRRGATRNIEKILRRSRPADVAVLLRPLAPAEQIQIFRLLPETEHQAEVLSFADPEIQAVLAEALDDARIVEILGHMSGDDAADIVELLPQERATRILGMWKGEDAAEVDTLLAYAPESAGGIMSPDVFALPEDTTIRAAIEKLQSSHEELEMAFYLYVVDRLGKLVGVCSLRQLVVSDPNKKLSEIMASDVVSVRVDTDQEEVSRLVSRYGWLAVPVVDVENRLVGIITVDDVIDVIREEATEDIFAMVGAGARDFPDQANALRSARLRLPWLMATFAAGIGSMYIIGGFHDALQKVTALAAFIPITLGMGGNVGTQAATIVTRGLALGRINVSRFVSVISREITVGVLCGLIYGLLLAAAAAFLYPQPDGAEWATWQLAVAVSLSVASTMTIAATIGGAAPLAFARIGVDPALATNPFVTTSTDLIGITTYFMIAKVFFDI